MTRTKITQQKKEEIKNKLISAGAVLRDKPLTPDDPFYSGSVGEPSPTGDTARLEDFKNNHSK